MKTNPTYKRRSSPTSWNTTSATLDYAGGNHRLVAIGSNATATVQRDFTTNANEQHSLSYNLALLNGGSATVKVQQKVGNTYYDLAGSTQTHTASGTYTFNFTPTEDDIRVVVNGNSRYALTQIFMDRNTIEEVIETYTLSAGGYRYGYQGFEKDNEVKGSGNSYTTFFRQLDPRLGRWLSLDPLFQNFPWQSPYVAFDNSPIVIIDPKGLAGEKVNDYGVRVDKDKNGKVNKITIQSLVYIKGEGASSKRAKELTDYAEKHLKSQVVNGIEVNMTIRYVYHENIEQKDLQPGENILLFKSESEGSINKGGQTNRSHVNAYKDYTGNTGVVFGSGKHNYTVLHESLHFMGLSDRYTDKGKTSTPHKGYENDIMGAYGKTSIILNHYKNIIDFVTKEYDFLNKHHKSIRYRFTNQYVDKYPNSLKP